MTAAVLRPLAAALMLLTVAACAGTDDGDGPPPVRARAYPTPEREAVVVQVVNLPKGSEVTAIELRTPDGVLTPSKRESSETVSAGESLAPEIGIGARGGSATGVEPHLTLSFSLFDWFWGGDAEANGKLERTEGRTVLARIPVPEDQRGELTKRTVTITLRDVAGTTRTQQTRVQGQ
ncbi:hypothetical protein SAMN05216241_106110 [Limimonas halophila]|uniref:Lipoprotein n=1 Tax=Limimonas halophila TaxID=1082479 RepID=A0A1G7S3Z5_9PROT|nr:hypothetical protein [Limimonas halophila]SDG17682.1 hypothetical protein SAMN05216241_106110 [Limimonas halophila]